MTTMKLATALKTITIFMTPFRPPIVATMMKEINGSVKKQAKEY
jgi:hypothetical protein